VAAVFKSCGSIVLTSLCVRQATIGYLLALASGPAALVVPLVATSPALAGLLGIMVLREKTSRRQLVGIAFALAGVILLSTSG